MAYFCPHNRIMGYCDECYEVSDAAVLRRMEKHLASIAESMKAFNESVVTNGPAIVEAMRMANVLAASIPAPNDD